MTDTATTSGSQTLVRRHFTEEGVDPYSTVEWKRFDVEIGELKMEGVEAPATWSQNAVNIVAKLYLAKGTYSETSVRQLIDRVAHKITCKGMKHGYFEGQYEDHGDGWVLGDDAQVFYDELTYILLHQLAAFNSPVWFNVGRPDRPQQCSACFILAVDDNTQSILDWVENEAFIFKGGSGAGVDISNLRGSMEPLSTGGTASGPVSFMRMGDAGAGTFKSGGTTRRAAKLVGLTADHPDIREFIWCKPEEERRLRALHAAGFNLDMNDPVGERNLAAATSFQNANNSVIVSDDFMERATGAGRHPRDWPLVGRRGGIIDKVNAGELLDEVAAAAWECADPGMLYNDTINRWHTTPAHGRINACNPCGEYQSNDDTSCNLASINVLRFLRWSSETPTSEFEPRFDVEAFRHTIDVMILAQEITVSFGDFPTETITQRSRELRQLGLGYSNMGAAIMAQGMAYDSDDARNFAASVTALMTGRAYRQSAAIAACMGPFDGFTQNRGAMLGVIEQHIDRLPDAEGLENGSDPWFFAIQDWHDARDRGRRHGYRNAQASLLAPAGTISFLMDCDTTGIEPAFSLVSFKKLAGGGNMTLVNRSVERALMSLGYQREEIVAIEQQLEKGGELPSDPSGSDPYVSPEHLPVFADAGQISPMGHLMMMEAVQPWLSGAISKTVNMEADTTIAQIRTIYEEAWRRGIKALAIYRDGSKASQVLAQKPKTQWASGSEVEVLPGTVHAMGGPHPVPDNLDEVELIPAAKTPHAEDAMEGPVGPERHRLPRERESITHKFNVGGFEGYIVAGKFEDGALGEIFLEDIGKEGSTLRGMMNAWAIAVSVGLQYGIPLELLVRKYSHMAFEPSGRTENLEIPTSKSLPDYIMRWLASRFLDDDMHEELGILTPAVKKRLTAAAGAPQAIVSSEIAAGATTLEPDPPSPMNGHARAAKLVDLGVACRHCGGMMQRTGNCETCRHCGFNTGCG